MAEHEENASDFGSEGSGDQAMEVDKAGDELDVSGDGGIMKKIITPGEGFDHPEPGADVTVHYVGTLLDGTQFDSSRDRGEPFNFKIGQGQVIKGWDQGVARMKKGEKAMLTCTAPYAYGEAGSPPKIPANATLQFEVELLSWTSDKDISKHGKDKIKPALLKKTLKEGENSYDHPKYGAKAVFTAEVVEGEGPAYENKEITVGDYQIEKVLERAVKNMAAGEVAIITAKGGSRYVKDDKDVKFKVTLHSFEKMKESWSLNTDEKLELANGLKEEGNAAFKAGQHKLAKKKYKHAIKYVETDYNAKGDEEKQRLAETLVLCANNAAAVAIALKKWDKVVENCNKALGKQPRNAKALMRRGKAYNEMNDWEAAATDLDLAHEVATEANDTASLTAINAERSKVQKKKAAHDAKEKKLFKNLFGKLSSMEESEAAAEPAEDPVPAPATDAPAPDAAPMDAD